MRPSAELEALRLRVAQDFKRITGTDLTSELLTKVVGEIFNDLASKFIRQRIEHLPLGDMLNFIKVIHDRPEEESPVPPRPPEFASLPKRRGRPSKADQG